MTVRNTLKKAQRGFTLIELLVVIGILAVLLAITLIAINPANQFAKANNTKRRSDVNAILNAVNQYMADNKGILPTGIATTVRTVSNTGADLCTVLVPKYIAALPVDPQTANGTPVTDCSAAYNTNYQVVQSTSDSRITVTAPGAELTETIAVTR
jgi:prepilin-type N-terminal cleavage/methylation domain-containing protein